VYATGDLAETLNAGLMLFVTPSKAAREVATRIASLGPKEGQVVVSCTKGIEHDSGKLMGDVIGEVIPKCRIAVLSGPNHAEEVAQKVPAAGVIGSRHADLLEPLQKVFSLPSFRAYTSDDVTGIQLGGSLKNVFAIAAGASDGFNMGDNAEGGTGHKIAGRDDEARGRSWRPSRHVFRAQRSGGSHGDVLQPSQPEP